MSSRAQIALAIQDVTLAEVRHLAAVLGLNCRLLWGQFGVTRAQQGVT